MIYLLSITNLYRYYCLTLLNPQLHPSADARAPKDLQIVLLRHQLWIMQRQHPLKA